MPVRGVGCSSTPGQTDSPSFHDVQYAQQDHNCNGSNWWEKKGKKKDKNWIKQRKEKGGNKKEKDESFFFKKKKNQGKTQLEKEKIRIKRKSK